MGMDQEAAESEKRFAVYVEQLASVMGHPARERPLRDYCTGLVMPLERKSVEPPGGADGTRSCKCPTSIAVALCRRSLVERRRGASRGTRAGVAIAGATGADPSVDHRRHGHTEERKAFSRGGASILRPAGQASQLPNGGVAFDRQSSCQSPHRMASLSAAGVDQRSRALQKGGCSEKPPL